MTNWKEICETRMDRTRKSVLPTNLKLPMLPKAVIEFGKKAKDPDATAKELGAIVESDAGLTCELLRQINSPAYGLRRQVQSAQHVISLLGLKKMGMLLAAVAVKSAMPSKDSRLINMQTFWNTNLERAIFAREVATLLKADKDLAYAGAMLQDFILPILTSQEADVYLDFSVQDGPRKPLSKFEHDRFGWDHAEAAAYLMRDWDFPEELIACVLLHHQGLATLANKSYGRTAAGAVAIAALMPDFFQQQPDGITELVRLEIAWPEFNLLEIAERVESVFHESAGADGRQHITFFRRVQKSPVCGIDRLEKTPV
ncbi:HDOD domain-containing protein [Thalassoroseus pseudoceratinae]|uniref:HDOD domain-containing protein n=1 Tax=Thalassoroseus pseudoceratinae TaxID=2713176 RepID=UPI0014208146|nr:HDOD domain-containing protein [Thalassoroseus pseudoceratinae]